MAKRAGPYTHTKANNVKRHEQVMRAYELRRDGMSYKDIAKVLGIAHGTARNWIVAELERTAAEPREEVRKIEVERLDYLYSKLKPRIDQGESQAINSALKVMDRRAKLLGLDMPVQVEVTTTTETDHAISGLLEEMEALNAKRAQHAGATDATAAG